MFIANAKRVAVQSWAVWVGYVAAGLIAFSAWLGTAPDNVQVALHAATVIPALKWIAAGLASFGVQIARVLQQGLSDGGTP